MQETDITGKKFNHLTAIRFDHQHKKPSGNIVRYWLFRCDCGKEKVIRKDSVLSGAVKSCGCVFDTRNHSLSGTHIHYIWSHIKQRCFSKKDPTYKYYGGRGITVCDEWKNDFMAFYNWAIENGYKDNVRRGICTLDRIDNNGNYCPENCRWVDMKKQTRNRRNNELVTYRGETLCLTDMAGKYGVKYATARRRLKAGKPLDVVFSKDVPYNKGCTIDEL